MSRVVLDGRCDGAGRLVDGAGVATSAPVTARGMVRAALFHYGRVVLNGNRVLHEVRAALGARPDERVLDFACGCGTFCLAVPGEYVGIDLDADYIAFWIAKEGASALAVYDVGDRELAKKYGVVDVGEGDRIVGFVEKPEDPPSTLAATAAYLYARPHAALVSTYLDEGNPPDQPGHLIAWLHRREPVYAYRVAGGWYDIGDADQLLEADNRLRAERGLPTRTAYSLG